MQPQKLVLYLWMGCNFLVLGIQLQRMAPVVNPRADSETGRIRKEAKREKRKRLGKCFCCNSDDVQLYLEAYVNEGQIAGKERSKL